MKDQEQKQRSKWTKTAKFGVLAGFMGTLLAGGTCATSHGISQQSARERTKKIEASPQWKDGAFRNELKAHINIGLGTLWKFIVGDAFQAPSSPLPVVKRTAADFATPPATGLRATWLGHSTILLEIDGARVLLDPVWGRRVSPFSWAGPKRFHAPPLPLKELLKLKIDAVVISHDHYDHLDEYTMRALAKTKTRFFVPLGVGGHMEKWGIEANRISELDWWQGANVGKIKLTAVPARHTSGRAVTFHDQDKTLWASWAITGPVHRAFFSGDTAMHPQFKEIGNKLGPFDLTMLEVGAYNQAWADVHMGPEQAVQAHRDLRGRAMLPIHWGTFDLGMHSWIEPVERTIAAAGKHAIALATPRPGDTIVPADGLRVTRWWPADIPWKTAAQEPVVSSGLALKPGHKHSKKQVKQAAKTNRAGKSNLLGAMEHSHGKARP